MTLAGAVGLAALQFAAAATSAEEMVFTSWGGTTQDAQKAWVVPFQKETG